VTRLILRRLYHVVGKVHDGRAKLGRPEFESARCTAPACNRCRGSSYADTTNALRPQYGDGHSAQHGVGDQRTVICKIGT
jgi:hypothetical protein